MMFFLVQIILGTLTIRLVVLLAAVRQRSRQVYRRSISVLISEGQFVNLLISAAFTASNPLIGEFQPPGTFLKCPVPLVDCVKC